MPDSRTTNHGIVWQTYWQLGDWFSRLGGAACYPSYHPADLGILIIVLLLTKQDRPALWTELLASGGQSLASSDCAGIDLLPYDLFRNAAPILGKTLKRLNDMAAMELSENTVLIREFAGYMNERLKSDGPSAWKTLCLRYDLL